MVDCRDSNLYEEDCLVHRVHCEDETELKDLTFSSYNYDLSNQEIVPLLKFDMSKVSITNLEDHNFKILYDDKPVLVRIKAFCALVKKVKT